ncbi:MAG: VCBS repeat-containing protein [Williamsia sp.]|nr:VCBS repeat-containing protein [Williamsia sp.]
MKSVSIFLIFILLFSSCTQFPRNKAHPEVSSQSIQRGMQLASVYCSSCHQLPDPSLLDAKSWEEGVLPHMGPRLGIYEFKYKRYPANLNDPDLPKGFYPSHASITPDEWQHIINYYTATSPDLLPSQQRTTPIHSTLPLFAAQAPGITEPSPGISAVCIHAAAHEFMTADLLRQNLVRYNNKLEVIDSLHLFGRLVDIQLLPDNLLTCNIGVFSPTNDKWGKLQLVATNEAGKMQPQDKPLLENLQRPVHVSLTDLNGDGKPDYLVCEFGYLTGSLSWYGQEEAGWKKHVLRAEPGAVKTVVEDYNHDGLPDIWALFAQGNEGVFLYTNKGKGEFEQQQVLRFPPSYGSSHFELADFNGDGFPDIVYTCGDNADYSTVLKPYHGVYIFLNDGTNHFTQRYFFPINGCYKAMARDFDGDGDLDLACIAFFADYKRQPQEGFVYLENTGGFRFEPYTILQAATGRWMTMDAGDVDGDGDQDILLGNFSVGPQMMKPAVDPEKGPPFLLLRNTTKP